MVSANKRITYRRTLFASVTVAKLAIVDECDLRSLVFNTYPN
jgi:hypothetical protein